MWNGFVNALKNAVSGWSAPKQAAKVNNVPSVKVNTASISKPQVQNTFVAPKASAPQLSKPASVTSPIQNSGIKVSLPSSAGISKPSVQVQQASMAKPNLSGFQGLSATAKLPSATNYQKQLADIINITKGLGGLGAVALNSNAAGMYGINALDSARNIIGGLTGVAGTALKAPELNWSEKLSSPVSAASPTLKPINTIQTKANETSGLNLTGGQWYGDTWVSAEEMKRRQAEADAFKGTGRAEVEKLKLVNPKLAQLQNDYNSGKINFNDYDAQVSALLNLGDPLGLGLNTGTTTRSVTPSLLGTAYDRAKLYTEDNAKTGQSNIDFYNNEASTINGKIEAAVNDVIRRYENGQMSVDDANREIAEVQKRELYAARDRSINQANTDLGIIDKDTGDYIASEDTQMSRYKDEAAQQKAQQGMTYDEMLKRAVKNKSLNEGNLRNVFAAAGTAESSDFQDRLMNLSQEAGAEQANIERTKGQTLAGIDKNVLNQLADSVTRKDTFTRKQTEQKNAILKAIEDLRGATEDKVFTVMADLATKIAAGKQNVGNQTAALYQTLLNNYTNQQNAGQLANQNKQLLMNNYTATNDINNIQSGTYTTGSGTLIKGSARPKGTPSDLWDAASQMMQSGVNAQAVMTYLKQQAQNNPTWQPWIGTMDTILGTNKSVIA